MTNIRPVNPDHSIKEVVFVIQLANPLSESAIEKIRQLAPTLKQTLPQEDVTHGVYVQTSGKPPLLSQGINLRINSVTFRRVGSNGKNELMLRAENNFISVNCFTYTKWDEVWGKVKHLLEQAGSCIISPEISVNAFILQYIDQFIFTGDKSSYSFNEIFNPDSLYVTKKAATAGPFWHIHQGWFESDQPPGASRCLSVLNINSATADKDHLTTIDNNCIAQYSTPITNPKTIFGSDAQSSIDTIFATLHSLNKKILKDLLSNQMQKKIGI